MLIVNSLDVDINGTPILRDIKLEIKLGEIVGLIGRNGAGKDHIFAICNGTRYRSPKAVSIMESSPYIRYLVTNALISDSVTYQKTGD